MKMQSKLVHVVDYGDFEDFVNQQYALGPGGYCFPADEETSNDTAKTYRIKKEPLDSWNQRSLDKFKAGEQEQFMARTLLQDFVNRDLLPEGEYVIKVSW
jgi:hypothetical protein